MPTYHFIPKAPLMFRDSRPFGANEHAETLGFPLPSTLAGALRTMYGDENNFDYVKDVEKLLKETVTGPLFTRTSTKTNNTELLFPAPADSVVFDQVNGTACVSRLTPQVIAASEGVDLPDNLQPVGLKTSNQDKPTKNPPRFWLKDKLVDWLIDDSSDQIEAGDLGERAIPIETRTHIAIDKTTLAAENGKLFQTACLDFGEQYIEEGNQKNWNGFSYGLLATSTLDISKAYRKLGGESRLAYVERDDALWPTCPEKLQSVLTNVKNFRLQFVTPAIFGEGWKPAWLDDNLTGKIPETNIDVILKAIALPRWQAVSGWDMQKQNHGQRPTRRMVPAGAVYWFEIRNNFKTDISKLWMKCITDERKSDGFGLVVPGVWNK